jgi:tetratricopeptide (TPR) repeat protein
MAVSLEELLSKLDSSPNDLDLINEVAMAYYQNPEWVKDDEDLKFFERAYNTKKTVKTTNNLAWQLYFEYGDSERSLVILNECLALNPSSHFPYNQIGYIQLNLENYEEALKYLKLAQDRSDSRDIVNNIGVAYFYLGNYDEAKSYFVKASNLNDIENISLYNLAVTNLALNNASETEKFLGSLVNNINNEKFDVICSYEIASVYSEMDYYDKATALVIELGLDGIDVSDWPDLGYALYKVNPTLFDETINSLIDERREWIIELDNEHEDWEDYSPADKLERIEELREEIKLRESLKVKFEMGKPDSKLTLFNEHCGCLLFGCEMHGNPMDDCN